MRIFKENGHGDRKVSDKITRMLHTKCSLYFYAPLIEFLIHKYRKSNGLFWSSNKNIALHCDNDDS